MGLLEVCDAVAGRRRSTHVPTPPNLYHPALAFWRVPHCPAGWCWVLGARCWPGAGAGRAPLPPSKGCQTALLFSLRSPSLNFTPLSPPTPSHSCITITNSDDASPTPARHGTSCIKAGPFLSPSRPYLAFAAILSPSSLGLFHDPHIDPNALHRPSQSSRHTLNPTGARASEQGVRAISTIVLGGCQPRFSRVPTVVAQPSLSIRLCRCRLRSCRC